MGARMRLPTSASIAAPLNIQAARIMTSAVTVKAGGIGWGGGRISYSSVSRRKSRWLQEATNNPEERLAIFNAEKPPTHLNAGLA